jgi:hypothetical protein
MYQLILARDRVTSIWIEPGKKRGDAIWVQTAEQARHLVEGGFAEWPKTAPSEVQQFEGPAERKSFGSRTDGPSTDLLSSASAHGLIRPSRV